MEPVDPISDEQIRERAYDLWDRHHRPDGYDLEFWFMARRELTSERQARLGDDAGDAKGDAGSPATVNSTATEEPTP